MLKNYAVMVIRLRRALEDFDFEITEDGKHVKLTYYSDGRYYTVFAKIQVMVVPVKTLHNR